MLLLNHRSVGTIMFPPFKWDHLMLRAKPVAPLYQNYNEVGVVALDLRLLRPLAQFLYLFFFLISHISFY